MNLFRYLKENMLWNQLKDKLEPALNNIQDLISDYILVGDNKLIDLTNIELQLNTIVEAFKELAFEYTPELVPDEDEEVFKNILNKFKDQVAYFLNNYDEKLFEQFNVQIQYILNLIEVHKASLKEDNDEI